MVTYSTKGNKTLDQVANWIDPERTLDEALPIFRRNMLTRLLKRGRGMSSKVILVAADLQDTGFTSDVTEIEAFQHGFTMGRIGLIQRAGAVEDLDSESTVGKQRCQQERVGVWAGGSCTTGRGGQDGGSAVSAG
jgi:hypothetical protein